MKLIAKRKINRKELEVKMPAIQAIYPQEMLISFLIILTFIFIYAKKKLFNKNLILNNHKISSLSHPPNYFLYLSNKVTKAFT